MKTSVGQKRKYHIMLLGIFCVKKKSRCNKEEEGLCVVLQDVR